MSEMVERVAMAIYASAPMFMSSGLDIETLRQTPWDKLDNKDRSEAREAAHAAISAMREPTETMIKFSGADKGDAAWREDLTEQWRNMIDVALAFETMTEPTQSAPSTGR